METLSCILNLFCHLSIVTLRINHIIDWISRCRFAWAQVVDPSPMRLHSRGCVEQEVYIIFNIERFQHNFSLSRIECHSEFMTCGRGTWLQRKVEIKFEKISNSSICCHFKDAFLSYNYSLWFPLGTTAPVFHFFYPGESPNLLEHSEGTHFVNVWVVNFKELDYISWNMVHVLLNCQILQLERVISEVVYVGNFSAESEKFEISCWILSILHQFLNLSKSFQHSELELCTSKS